MVVFIGFSSGRDPSQHATLAEKIEEQSSAKYASARLWDDGIIRPQDTRDLVGLGLAIAAGNLHSQAHSSSTGTFGVFRM